MDATAYIALYAIKAFVPLYALSVGINVAVVGLFFAVQELVRMVVQPAGGRLGDKWGYLPVISLGMLLLGLTLPLLPLAHTTWGLMGITILLGLAQAFIFPSTTALVSARIDGRNLGAAMGIIGTLDNAGKVIGPVLGGLLIARFDYAVTFDLLGGLLLLGAVLVGVASLSRRGLRETADVIG
jgi:MFS family permease